MHVGLWACIHSCVRTVESEPNIPALAQPMTSTLSPPNLTSCPPRPSYSCTHTHTPCPPPLPTHAPHTHTRIHLVRSPPNRGLGSRPGSKPGVVKSSGPKPASMTKVGPKGVGAPRQVNSHQSAASVQQISDLQAEISTLQNQVCLLALCKGTPSNVCDMRDSVCTFW